MKVQFPRIEEVIVTGAFGNQQGLDRVGTLTVQRGRDEAGKDDEDDE